MNRNHWVGALTCGFNRFIGGKPEWGYPRGGSVFGRRVWWIGPDMEYKKAVYVEDLLPIVQ